MPNLTTSHPAPPYPASGERPSVPALVEPPGPTATPPWSEGRPTSVAPLLAPRCCSGVRRTDRPARTSSVRTRAEDGQTLPLMAVVVLLACAVALAAVRLGDGVARRAQAQTAADASALAGAAEGRSAARQLAQANGAVLVSFAIDGEAVHVEVERRGAKARARASRTIEPLAPAPRGP